MRRYFVLDLYTFALSLLPSGLRQVIVVAFVRALHVPADWLYSRFFANRGDNLYRLAITSQVCYLEKALNDRFDAADRRIYIGDGSINRSTHIYTHTENYPLYACVRSEKRPIYLYVRNSSGTTEKNDFIISVPASLSFDHDELRALVDRSKLASKTYTIRIYE